MADSLRGRESARSPAPGVTPSERPDPSPELVRRLRDEGLAGLLVVADADCRVRTLRLPGLERSAGLPGEVAEDACALRGPETPRASRRPFGVLLAACREGRISVGVSGRAPLRELDGCMPAWRPDGALAFVRDGSLRAVDPTCPGPAAECQQVVLDTADLRRTGVVTPEVVDHAWLSPTRAAVLLRWPGGGYVLGVYEGARLLALHRWGGPGPGRLEVAAGGGLFTARPARVFRRDGTVVTLAPRFRNARAVDWSPDGNWAAVAMVGAIVLVPTHGLVAGADTRRAIRLPYPARDLAWRP